MYIPTSTLPILESLRDSSSQTAFNATTPAEISSAPIPSVLTGSMMPALNSIGSSLATVGSASGSVPSISSFIESTLARVTFLCHQLLPEVLPFLRDLAYRGFVHQPKWTIDFYCYSDSLIRDHPHMTLVIAWSIFFGPIVLMFPLQIAYEVSLQILYHLVHALHGWIPAFLVPSDSPDARLPDDIDSPPLPLSPQSSTSSLSVHSPPPPRGRTPRRRPDTLHSPRQSLFLPSSPLPPGSGPRPRPRPAAPAPPDLGLFLLPPPRPFSFYQGQFLGSVSASPSPSPGRSPARSPAPATPRPLPPLPHTEHDNENDNDTDEHDNDQPPRRPSQPLFVRCDSLTAYAHLQIRFFPLYHGVMTKVGELSTKTNEWTTTYRMLLAVKVISACVGVWALYLAWIPIWQDETVQRWWDAIDWGTLWVAAVWAWQLFAE
ncbi:hypothetical protein AX16_006257 [Volvariella volvacea WC 439]|nr:hypothetical protein AX16_006257 [Volvariella volvacea WC 439]